MSDYNNLTTAEENAIFKATVWDNPYIPKTHIPFPRQIAALLDFRKELLYGGAAGGGKLIYTRTPILTSMGITTIENLQVGDTVFDENGKQCFVLAVSDVENNRECYKLTFSDGSELIAADTHLWPAISIEEEFKLQRRTPEYREKRRASRPSRGTGKRPDLAKSNSAKEYKYLPKLEIRNKTTKELFDTQTIRDGRTNYYIPVCKPLRYPEKDLILDPYVLGVWCGDGTKGNSIVTGIDEEIFEMIRKNGFKVKQYDHKHHYVTGLIKKIKEIGCYRNKHIPEEYFTSSVKQRVDLLRGIMDTDGYATKNGGCEIQLTRKELIDDISRLLHTLGIKHEIHEGEAKLYGRVTSKKWRIKFFTHIRVFNLKRKFERQKQFGLRKTTIRRYIEKIEKVDSVPVKCIKVSSLSGQYLVGESLIPTHNSDYLLMAGLQFVGVPGYNGIIFRRSYTDLSLPDGLIPRSHEWLTGTDARYKGDLHQWVFPAGSTLTFGYLESENDIYRYKSAQFQFCVAEGTPILSKNNKYINIEDIKENDVVMTLEGLKRVTKIWGARTDKCVKAETYTSDGEKIGEQIHPITHKFLTPFGWQSFSSICNQPGTVKSKQYYTSHTPSSREGLIYQYPQQTCVSPHDGLKLREPSQSHLDHLPSVEQISYLIDDRIDSTANEDEGQETQMLLPLCVPVVLYAPHPPLNTDPYSEDYEEKNVRIDSSPLNSQLNYSTYRNPCGEYAQSHLDIFQYDLPLSNDADEYIHFYHNLDVKERIPTHTRLSSISYAHPYTKDTRNSSEAVQYGSCVLTPVGNRLVYDISVEDVSHYITLALLVNINCGYEELTEFPTERFYTYLFSRMRKLRTANVPVRMRCTTNPDGPGADWVYERFKPEGPQPTSIDRNFIQSKLDDNPHIDQEGYEANLDELDPVTREQLRNGAWRVKKSGNKFKQEWFDRAMVNLEEVPQDGIVVRYWDLAATEEKKRGSKTTDPDWTVGARVRLYQNKYYIEDIRRGRFAPGALEDFIRDTAEMDSQDVMIFIEQEPGATGKMVIDDYLRRVLSGYAAFGDRPSGNKEMRANIFSAALFNGNVRMVRADWNKSLVNECCLFPSKGIHDDQCLVAGTKIATIHGDKNIEDIEIGDVVITPGGTSTVIWSGQTGENFVITNKGITGTFGHKVFNGTNLFIPLLTHDVSTGVDTLCVANQIRWIARRLYYSMGLNIDSWARKDITLASIPQMKNEEPLLKVCMWPFMSFIREKKYHRAALYITKMAIHSITQLKILSVWYLNNMRNSLNRKIGKVWRNILMKLDHSQQNGIDQKKEGRGIENMLKALATKFTLVIVLFVNWCLLQVIKTLNIVAGNVTKKQDGLDEKPMDIKISEEKHPVYNITTEPSHTFFANGILVSNCDAVSGAIGRLPRAKRWKSGEIGSVETSCAAEGYSEFNNGPTIVIGDLF